MDLEAEMEMESQQAKDKLQAVAEELGHEIRVFTSRTYATIPSKLPSAADEEEDDFYELHVDDYFKLTSNKVGEANILKTSKMREEELAAKRAKFTKAVMRVRFPDGYILEADFHPSQTIQNLLDLLLKVIARPDLPFYLYTVPPKKRIEDASKDFYTVGFVPGANIYFSYDLSEGSELNTEVLKSEPYLREEIRSLDGLSLISKPAIADDSNTEADDSNTEASYPADPSPAKKKPARPKWFKR